MPSQPAPARRPAEALQGQKRGSGVIPGATAPAYRRPRCSAVGGPGHAAGAVKAGPLSHGYRGKPSEVEQAGRAFATIPARCT
jgi:hypothetical protein